MAETEVALRPIAKDFAAEDNTQNNNSVTIRTNSNKRDY